MYTFATPKLQPFVTLPEGKNLIQACLNAPDSALQIPEGGELDAAGACREPSAPSILSQLQHALRSGMPDTSDPHRTHPIHCALDRYWRSVVCSCLLNFPILARDTVIILHRSMRLTSFAEGISKRALRSSSAATRLA